LKPNKIETYLAMYVLLFEIPVIAGDSSIRRKCSSPFKKRYKSWLLASTDQQGEDFVQRSRSPCIPACATKPSRAKATEERSQTRVSRGRARHGTGRHLDARRRCGKETETIRRLNKKIVLIYDTINNTRQSRIKQAILSPSSIVSTADP
jgi:hypothetical protein